MKKNYKNIIKGFAIIQVAILITLMSMGCKQAKKEDLSGDLVIFHAGSLSMPMKEIVADFKKSIPKRMSCWKRPVVLSAPEKSPS